MKKSTDYTDDTDTDEKICVHLRAMLKTGLFLLFFLSVTLLAAENPVQELFFELTRQTVCGASRVPIFAETAAFSAIPARFFTRSVWRVGAQNPQYLIEVFYPEKSGVLDATFSPDDVFGVVEAGEGAARTDWVDAVLLAMKFSAETLPESADEAVGYDVAERMLSDMDNRDDSGIVEGQNGTGDEPAALTFTDSEGRLRRFTYGAEHFSVRERDGIKTAIDSADGLVIRRTFDAGQHLIRQERFKAGASSRDITLLSRRDYRYHEGEKLPYQMTEDITDGNKHLVTDYDENGFAVKVQTAHYEYPDKNDKKHKDDPPRLVQDKKNLWAYDDERRLVAEETTTYFYTKTTTGKEKVEQNAIRKTYDYDGAGGSKPDVSYFENDVLRIRTVYERENVYNETMYFDDGFTVQTQYVDGVKVLEIMLIDGTELRRRTFEN